MNKVESVKVSSKSIKLLREVKRRLGMSHRYTLDTAIQQFYGALFRESMGAKRSFYASTIQTLRREGLCGQKLKSVITAIHREIAYQSAHANVYWRRLAKIRMDKIWNFRHLCRKVGAILRQCRDSEVSSSKAICLIYEAMKSMLKQERFLW